MKNASENSLLVKDKVKEEVKESPSASGSGKLEDKAVPINRSHGSATKVAAKTLEQWLERNPPPNPNITSPFQGLLSNSGQSASRPSPARLAALNQELSAVEAEYTRLARSCAAFPPIDCDIKLMELKKETAAKKLRIRKKYGVSEE
jgi:hypothetical protein